MDRDKNCNPEEMSPAGGCRHEAFNNALIDSFPGSFTISDVNGKLVSWNAFHRDELVGKPESEIAGIDAIDVFHPDDRPIAIEKIMHVLLEGVEVSAEGRVLIKGGPEFQWRMITGRRIIIDGDPFVVAFSIDITERKRLEDLMAFRLSLNEMADSATVEELLRATLDEAERLTGSTISFCQFIDADEENPSFQVISTGMHNNLKSHFSAMTHKSFDQAWIRDEAVSERRAVCHNNSQDSPNFRKLPDDHPQITRTLVVPLIRSNRVAAIFSVAEKRWDYNDNDVKLVGALADLAWDIVARKRAEESEHQLQDALLQAQKMELIGQLAGGVAHDFNNMLGVILGNVEFALNRPSLDESLKNNLKDILKATGHSAELTRQLLAFSRKGSVIPIVLDLNTMLEKMLSILRRLIGEDISLLWIPASGRTLVKIDPAQVDLVLGNLCVNARDAITDHGVITIETSIVFVDSAASASGHPCKEPGSYVSLAVTDNGCGIDKKNLPHIFEPFFTTKKAGQGTGMGLSTVYGIVKQNNAVIDCKSQLGKGSTFTIFLPLQKGYADPDHPFDPAPPKSHGKETILLVEDEPDILNLCKMMLQESEYAILSAPTPGEAIRIADAYDGQIHLLVTDVIMPEMNGVELSRNIQAIRPGIKTLFISGYTTDIIARHGVLEHGIGFISKPFSIYLLLRKVHELLNGTFA
ncbi:MAG: GAF domain-containing protein [Chlorobiaceae bacterium]